MKKLFAFKVIGLTWAFTGAAILLILLFNNIFFAGVA
jgi:hypothetical protein